MRLNSPQRSTTASGCHQATQPGSPWEERDTKQDKAPTLPPPPPQGGPRGDAHAANGGGEAKSVADKLRVGLHGLRRHGVAGLRVAEGSPAEALAGRCSSVGSARMSAVQASRTRCNLIRGSLWDDRAVTVVGSSVSSQSKIKIVPGLHGATAITWTTDQL